MGATVSPLVSCLTGPMIMEAGHTQVGGHVDGVVVDVASWLP